MVTAIERLDTRVADARKALDKATAKRDGAIKALIRAVGQIKSAQQALARTEKRRVEARRVARASSKNAARSRATDGPTGL